MSPYLQVDLGLAVHLYGAVIAKIQSPRLALDRPGPGSGPRFDLNLVGLKLVAYLALFSLQNWW